MRTWTMHVPGVPWSINEERSKHWTWSDRLHRETRDQWCDEARANRLPRGLTRIGVVAQPIEDQHPGKPVTGRMLDTGNCYPSVKAAIDGLVLARVIPDDDGAHVAYITMLAPIAGAPALILTINEVDPQP